MEAFIKVQNLLNSNPNFIIYNILVAILLIELLFIVYRNNDVLLMHELINSFKESIHHYSCT